MRVLILAALMLGSAAFAQETGQAPAKKKKGSKESDVTITVEDGDDVIIRDIDD